MKELEAGVLREPEFYCLERELEEIEKLIGVEDDDTLIARTDKILDRLEGSKEARIRGIGLKLIQ